MTNRRRRLTTHWLIVVLIGTCLLLLFSKLAKEVVEGQLNLPDATIRSWMLAHRSRAGDRFFAALTLLGSTVASLILVGTVAIWQWLRKQRWAMVIFVSAPAAAVVLLLVLRALVRRQRPPGAIEIVATYSFPGGHMVVATSLWVTLMYLLRGERLLGTLPAVVVAVAWPLLIGVSRLYLDLHWASDIVAGWVLGLLLAVTAAGAYERWSRRSPLAATSSRDS